MLVVVWLTVTGVIAAAQRAAGPVNQRAREGVELDVV